jgi:hypothetical protein
VVRVHGVCVRGKQRGSSAARATHARTLGRPQKRTETGATPAQPVSQSPKRAAKADHVKAHLPISETEVELMLHWAGDLLAGLMQSDEDG